MENCLSGMFDIYQRIFGIRIEKHDPPEGYVWSEGVDYYQVTDVADGQTAMKLIDQQNFNVAIRLHIDKTVMP